MAKKANAAPAEAIETPETEVTASAAIDQPAVSDDESASSSSPAEPEAPSSPADPAIVEPEVPAVVEDPVKEEPVKAGGGFDHSPFAESKPAPTMIERIAALEARVAVLEAK